MFSVEAFVSTSMLILNQVKRKVAGADHNKINQMVIDFGTQISKWKIHGENCHFKSTKAF